MFEIIEEKRFSSAIKMFVVSAHEISAKARAGQFIIIRIDEKGERIPLTIADFDRKAGTITMIFQEVGKSTKQLGTLKKGDSINDIVGPLGRPSEIEKYGTVCCIGGGVGTAPIFPIAKALKEEGNKVISIIGARNKDLMFWEDKMKSVSDELFITTDDGSYVRKGLVTDVLKELVDKGYKFDIVVAIGPTIMMRAVVTATKELNLKTIVSLNPIMVDGTGMCGACRVTVAGKTQFVCVDGPDFDGHQVDFVELMDRMRFYKDDEALALNEHQKCFSK